MILVERDSFLMELHRRLEEAAGGDGGVVLIGGDAGIGKSALVGRWCTEIAAQARVLLGACDALSTPRPLGPLVDIATLTDGELGVAVRTGAGRDVLFGLFLSELTGHHPRPTVALIEDAHWADEATLDLIRFVGRRLGGTTTLLVVTYRDDEVGSRHPLRAVLGDLTTTASPLRLNLPALSVAAMCEMAAAGDINAVALHRQTGGNPFFATEILAARAFGLPPTVRDAVLARLARLSPEGRVALDAAAVLGSGSAPGEVIAVSGANVDAIEACLAGGMLEVVDGRLSFRHELARRAVLGSIVPPQLAALLQMALEVLRSLAHESLDLRRLAHHAEGAGDANAVLEYAPAAAKEASVVQAHREATAQYDRVLRFAAGMPDAARATLFTGFATACSATARVHDAIAARWELIEIARRAGNAGDEAANLARISGLLVSDGRNDEAESTIGAALNLLDLDTEDPGHVVPFQVYASLRMLNRDNHEAILWGRRAIALAERFGDTASLVSAANAVGSARMLSGDEDGGRKDLEWSRDIAVRAGLDTDVSAAFANLGSCYGEIYRFDLAERYLTEGIAHASARDLDSLSIYMSSWLALIRMYQGRWDDAVAEANSVLRRSNSTVVSRMMALVAIGRVRTRRGDPDVAAALDEATALAKPTGTLQRVGPVQAARAEAAWLAGDAKRTLAEAQAAWDLAVRHAHPWHVGELAFWRSRAGVHDVVAPAGAEPWARQLRGDWAGAAVAWEERGCLYETARALADADDEAALRRALEIFEHLGARPGVAAVSFRLRALGFGGIPRGPRSSTRAHPAGLIRRESEILSLVANGQTNGEIAARLFLSPKTVEHHVSSILSKLGARTRTEAVEAARRIDRALEFEGASPAI